MSPDELFARVDKQPGCWIWHGSHVPNGYGNIRWEGKNRPVHRVVYEILVGPIPGGKQLDHLCRVRDCVNPAHLEPVTQRENVLRGNGATARHARKTHCNSGHEFTPENTRIENGGRRCLTCLRDKNHRRSRKVAA